MLRVFLFSGMSFRVNCADANNINPRRKGREGHRISLHVFDERLLKKLIIALDNTIINDQEIKSITKSLRKKMKKWPSGS